MDRKTAAGVFSLAIAIGAVLLASPAPLIAGGPEVLVNGVVRDGAGHDWPLYAKLEIHGPVGFPDAMVFTDPVTGYYAVSLPTGATYDVAVTGLTPGYLPENGQLTLSSASASAVGGVVANWRLSADPLCTGPGFGPGSFVGPLDLSEGFDGGVLPAGWSVETNSGVSWKVFTGATACVEGNRTGGTGPYAMVHAACETMLTFDDTYLVTPAIDLSARTHATLQWASDFVDFNSGGQVGVDVSVDGGGSWVPVWTVTTDLPGPSTQIVDLTFAAGYADVRVRFHYQGFFAYWWQVDDVKIGAFACGVLPGGLVVGNVRDANTGAGLNGAEVAVTPDGGSTLTFATPEDEGQPDGMYALFADGGPESIEASLALYASSTRGTTVIPDSAVRLDFELASGLLEASPRPLALVVLPGGQHDVTLTLANSGGVEAGYVIREVDLAPPVVPFAAAIGPVDRRDTAAAIKRIPFARLSDRSTRDLPPPAKAPSNVPGFVGAGDVVSSFPTGLTDGWGLAYDTDADRLWISNPDAPDFGFGGDGLEHQFTPGGSPTGETIDIHDTGGAWQADGTYNGRTGKLWQANVGGDYCLFAMDPVAKVVTGERICGPWSIPQRGLAYDYATDTYFAGGTGDATVYHIDPAGNLIDSGFIGIAMVGLAYNPTTRHLFVAAQGGAPPWDVWVFDAANGYAPIGGFVVGGGGVSVLEDGGVSLEASCNGHLWITDDLTQTVYEFESGESGWCVDDIPWLSEAPAEGTVAGGGELPVTVTFDTTGLLPGLRQRSLFFSTDTPTAVEPIPVDFTILFSDVAPDGFAANFIAAAAGAGVMPGCEPQTPTFAFCPAEIVTRRTMAGYIERAAHGASTPPPVYLDGFGDVQPGSFNADYIQGLVDDGVTAGCSASPALYCPDVPVTRAQMAVFVWKGRHGAEAPPACEPPGTFADVPCPGGFAVDYIEAIHAEGVTAGCGGGLYCPNAGIPNAQMAVFLVKAFGLPYLP